MNDSMDTFEFDEEDVLVWNGLNNTDSMAITFRDSSRFWIQRVIMPIVVIVGVLGNIITIWILTRRPMRSSTNVYLTALAVSDLLFLLLTFSLSLSHYSVMSQYWFYWWYKPFGYWINDAASSTSVWITVSFTIERYIAVCHPMRGKILCTEERAIKVAILVYFICFASTSSTPFEWTIANSTNTDNETIYLLNLSELGQNDTYRTCFFWFSSIMFVFIPLAILSILNTILIQTVRRSRIARKQMTNQQNSSTRYLQTLRQENRITITLIAVVIVFLICQLPTGAVLLYDLFHVPSPEGDALLRGIGNICNLLVALNAACNFLLYTALSDKYRKYFCAYIFFWRKSPGQQFNDGDLELTMNSTISFSRGTSLRTGYSIRNPQSIKRVQNCNQSPKLATDEELKYLNKSPGENKAGNKPVQVVTSSVRDASIPLIHVDKV